MNNNLSVFPGKVNTLANKIGLNLADMPQQTKFKAERALEEIIEEMQNNPIFSKNPKDEFIRKSIESSKDYQY